MNDDKLILAQAEDRLEQCQAYDMLTHTGFLDARQQSLVRRAFGERRGDVRIAYYGGYGDADRVIMAALPYYMQFEESLPTQDAAGDEERNADGTPEAVRELLTVIRATVPKGSTASRSGRALSHSDYLGALTGLGLKRTVIGDILVRDDGADIIVLTDIADFLMNTFASAGRSHLSLERLSVEEGAELVIRHKGKVRLAAIGGRSRKDRINVTFEKYWK